MSTHSERPGHCPACAAKLATLAARVQRLEQLLEDLDATVGRFIRATPATPEAVPTALPTDVTVPARKGAP